VEVKQPEREADNLSPCLSQFRKHGDISPLFHIFFGTMQGEMYFYFYQILYSFKV
jgi:hypothetical protein